MRIPAVLTFILILVGCDQQPPDRADVLQVVAASQDLGRYEQRFADAATWLVMNTDCELRDIAEGGGWSRSVDHPGHYFVWCGGSRVGNPGVPTHKRYLEIRTGRVSTGDRPGGSPSGQAW